MFYETLILCIHRPPVSDDVVPQAPPVSSGSDSDLHSDSSAMRVNLRTRNQQLATGVNVVTQKLVNERQPCHMLHQQS